MGNGNMMKLINGNKKTWTMKKKWTNGKMETCKKIINGNMIKWRIKEQTIKNWRNGK